MWVEERLEVKGKSGGSQEEEEEENLTGGGKGEGVDKVEV